MMMMTMAMTMKKIVEWDGGGADVDVDGDSDVLCVCTGAELILYQLLRVVPTSHMDRPDAYGWSPLHILANASKKNIQKRASRMVKRLCYEGAKVDSTKAKGNQPIHGAAAVGNKAVCDALLMAGADPNAENDNGTRPYDFASKNDTVLQEWMALVGAEAGAGTEEGQRQLVILIVYICLL